MSLLALFATVTLIARASACCLPEQYSADTLVEIYEEGYFYQGTGKVYFDNTVGMQASFFNITVDENNGIHSLSSIHFDVNTRNLYIMTGGQCKKEKMDESWLKETDQAHCIPDSAKLVSSFALGGPHKDIKMNRYIQPIKGGQRQFIVTQDDCYPVQEYFFNGNKNKNGFQVKDSTKISMANFKLTVDDPSVFVLPDICKKTLYSTKRNIDKNLPANPWQVLPFLASV